MSKVDKQEYGHYLLAMGGEDIGLHADEQVEEEHLYGLFQWFMPSGEGVERVFESLPNGELLLNRIRPIYEMLNPEDFASEYVPGYFNGGFLTTSEEIVRGLGEQLIKGLKDLFSQVPEEDEMADGAKEALEALELLQEVVVLPPGELSKLEQGLLQGTEEEDGDIVYEVLGELISSRSDYDENIQLLSEAYYSIACDYWLAYYLQWPRYQGLQESENSMRPYFELYRYGYNLYWTQTKLMIGKR